MAEKVKVRDSNMELLRCFAMLLVCLFHIDFINFNFPDNQLNIDIQPVQAFLKIWATAITFTCVDVFILLSGWYGIHFKKKRLFEFLFQVLFFSITIYVFMLIFDKNVTFKWQFLVHILVTDDYWFVPAYLSLYIFSPVINSFIEKTDKHTFGIIIIAMLLLQSVFGWISPNEAGYLEGRSPFSFFILYMLARYVHVYGSKLKAFNKKTLISVFCILTLSESLIVLYGYKIQQQNIIDTIFKFSSLFTIFAALCIVLFFYHIKLKSKIVNWIGRSSFAVFLLHCFPYFNEDAYKNVLKIIYTHYNGIIYILYVSFFIVIIYTSSILLDQIRIYIYNKIKV